VITLEDYFIDEFVRDWGLEILHMIRHLEFSWSGDSWARIDDLDSDHVSAKNFYGLETVELYLLGETKDAHLHSIGKTD
jgi:hypothetical protein